MSLSLHTNAVVLDLAVRDKDALFERLVQVLTDSGSFGDAHPGADAIREAVRARESERTTGLGEGVAFPHARLAGITGVHVAFARLAEPLDYDSPDGQPVQLVLLMVAGDDEPEAALQVMAHFAELVREPKIRRRLLMTENPSTAAAVLMPIADDEAPVYARDIMRPTLVDIYPGTPLAEVTAIMLEHNLDAISVVDPDDQTLVGFITCDEIFQWGMPDFFRQLRSVSFLRFYDPMRQYFSHSSDAVAADVMSKDIPVVPEDATLLEVVFELSVKKQPKVYVVEGRKRIGVIDRIVLLDRVLNP